MNDSFKNNSERERKAEQIVNILESEFEVDVHGEGSAFLTLVRTILSQNTNRKNTKKAFENLVSEIRKPSEFAKADREDIVELIRPAGLYKNKSKSIKKISELVTEESEKELDKILQKSPEEAREELLTLPGVGPKTADCVLLFSGGRDVLPVDTHIARISKRLGFANEDDGPEEVKDKLEPFLPEGKRGEAHLLLIELGRNYCTARNPDCIDCPLEDICPKIGLD